MLKHDIDPNSDAVFSPILPARLVQYGLCALLCFIVSATTAWAESEQNIEAYYSGLRERGLHRLAEEIAQNQLAQEDVDEEVMLATSLELAQTYAEHAATKTGDESDALWSLATETLDRIASSLDAGPEIMQVVIRRTVIEVLHARHLSHLSLAQPGVMAIQTKAREKLQAALVTCEKVADLLKNDETAGELTDFQRRQFATRISFLRAQLLLKKAEMSVDDVVELSGAVAEAEQLLQPLIQQTHMPELAWQSKVMLVRCARLLRDDRNLQLRLQAFDDESPTAYRQQALAQQFRSWLAKGEASQVGQAIIDLRRTDRTIIAELDFLMVRALWQLAELADERNDKSLARQFRDQAEERVAEMRRLHGGMWTFRAQVLLGESLREQELGPEISSLLKVAQQNYEQRNFQVAADLYRSLFEKALARGLATNAVEYGITSGSIFIQQQDWTVAAAILKRAADVTPASARSAEAHLLWAYALSQVPPDQIAELSVSYEEALQEHLSKFADQQTAPQARSMLATAYVQQGKTVEAISTYQQVEPSDAGYLNAQVEITELKLQLLDEGYERRDANWKQALSDTIATTETLLAKRNWSRRQPLQVELTRALVRLQLLDPPANLMRVEQRIVELHQLRESTEAEDHALLLVCWIGQKNLARVTEYVGRLSLTPQDWITCLETVTESAPRLADDTAFTAGEVQWMLLTKLEQTDKARLSAEQQRWLLQTRMDVALKTGRLDEAITLFREEIRRQPRDVELRKQFSSALRRCGSQDCLREAKRSYQQLAALQKEGTEEWLRTRLALIDVMLDLEETQDAGKLFQLTGVLYPRVRTMEALADDYAGVAKRIGNR